MQFKYGVRDNKEKLEIIEQVYSIFNLTMCIVFVNSKAKALKIKSKLEEKGYSAKALLGGGAMTDDERKEIVT